MQLKNIFFITVVGLWFMTLFFNLVDAENIFTVHG
jgi:hypothetical protein